MSKLQELVDAERAFLEPFLPPSSRDSKDTAPTIGPSIHMGPGSKAHDDRKDRPFVTLTYACSLDGMISLAPGLRTTLSGPETKSMTHFLRMKHDAILIGVGTAIPDDPSLNCRYPGATLDSQPQPVVLDPRGRWNVENSKVVKVAQQGQGKLPWVLSEPGRTTTGRVDEQLWRRLSVSTCYVPTDDSHSRSGATPSSSAIDWPDILRLLHKEGINSVMIEGGSTVISTLLSKPDLVDSVVVTIAPTWLGQGGVTVVPPSKLQSGERVNASTLSSPAWRQFGADAVLCGRMIR